jgi:hypothetical protein
MGIAPFNGDPIHHGISQHYFIGLTSASILDVRFCRAAHGNNVI